ncbi:MAG: decaprenyl-phosphate phosphoribosyltransferase [Pseudomonadota bacterium]|jgi:4-hydroxybenzoate polyprenyltransferase
MNIVKAYIKLLRPHHWVKNGFVLAPIIFADRLFNVESLILETSAFAVFCLVSSAVYALNDVFDRELDRNHPTKKNRPVASGQIPAAGAVALSIFLMAAGILGAAGIGKAFLAWVVFYLLLQFGYNVFLKKIVILDILTVAMGFVIRAVAGSLAIRVVSSPWLILCSLLIALFLGFAKRRQEMVLMGEGAGEHRSILREYSIPLLDQLIGIVTAATIVCYAIYTLTPEVTHRLGSRYMILTLPFVLYGIFRYLYLVHVHEKGGSPTRDLLSDTPLLLSILLWTLTSVGLIYF